MKEIIGFNFHNIYYTDGEHKCFEICDQTTEKLILHLTKHDLLDMVLAILEKDKDIGDASKHFVEMVIMQQRLNHANGLYQARGEAKARAELKEDL